MEFGVRIARLAVSASYIGCYVSCGGERTPHLDATARGGWIGLTAKHTRADMIRSLLEGVANSQKDCLDIIEGMGARVESVRLSGGGARSAISLVSEKTQKSPGTTSHGRRAAV